MTEQNKVDVRQKIGDYQRELLNWLFHQDDGRERGDETPAHDPYEYQGGSY